MSAETEKSSNLPTKIGENITVASDNTVSDEITEETADLLKETKLLRDTLDLLLNKSLDHRKICEQLAQENKYLQEYVENLMSSGDVLEK